MKLFKNGLILDKRDNVKQEPIKTEDGYVIQMLNAEVIKVGSEVTGEVVEEVPETKKNKKNKKEEPAIFSYKYKFTNPITGQIQTAYDDLTCVEVGEQIYDVGEMAPVIFSSKPNKQSGTDFTITRKIIFPEVINKKKKRIRIAKILYFTILIALIFICMCFSLSNQSLENGSGLEDNTETVVDEINDKE